MYATFKPILTHRECEVNRVTLQYFGFIPTASVSVKENILRSENMSSKSKSSGSETSLCALKMLQPASRPAALSANSDPKFRLT
jgi:hypothetical protein